MYKKIFPYELGKIGLLLCELAAVATIAYSFVRVLWFGTQFALAPVSLELMLQIANAVPEKLAIVGKILEFFATDMSAAEAKEMIIHYAVWLAVGLVVLMLARFLLKLLERRFKQRFMPVVLRENFSDFTYEAKKRRAAEETLCDVGLLSHVERYYSANRLQGLYRDCWVASEEIVCGGVYGDNYTSYKVKARGQWLTIRLNTDFEGTLVLESRGTKNRFSRRGIAARMFEVTVNHTVFEEHFRCFSNSTEDVYALLTRQMADKLLLFQDKYPDVCVIFTQGCVHALVRRRSFDRRWEPFIPFCLRHLRTESTRLYGSLQDLTDLLLE